MTELQHWLQQWPATGQLVVARDVYSVPALLQTARQLARDWRRSSGVQPGQRLLLSAQPDADFVVQLLACWYAGALPLLLDPWTARQLQGQSVLPWQARGLLSPAGLQLSATAIQPGQTPDAALVLFTSGSSGEPKGVLLGAQRLQAHLQALAAEMALDSPAPTGIVLPLNHSFALITQLLQGLSTGSPIHLLPTLPGERLAYLAAHAIERLAGVSTHFRWLFHSAASGMTELRTLRHLTVAGAALDPALHQQILQRCPAATLWIGYGLTEAGPRVSVLPHQDPAAAAGSAGRPLRGIQVRLDAQGVLELQSPYTMLGYLDSPQQTAAVLREGWLQTGDLARIGSGPDDIGCLYILGRADTIFEVGGEKIVPQAIEQLLLELPGVRQAAVLTEPHPLLGQQLVALIVGEATQKALQRLVRSTLPPALRPQVWYTAAELPLTANGKLRRAALQNWPRRPLDS
ncbi:MAG: acyl--CoA ligase [Candidatus Sericytochromatia bacterium]|nr:acyl--CoA ligase [Candidatus Sericytochromatia bacterium]